MPRRQIAWLCPRAKGWNTMPAGAICPGSWPLVRALSASASVRAPKRIRERAYFAGGELIAFT